MATPQRVETRVDEPADEGARLDVYVAGRLGLFSRSQAKARIISATVNGSPARLARRLRLGDVVIVEWSDPPPSDLAPEDIPLDILFESADVVVVDKPQGMVVHPGSGNSHGTLVNALLFRYAGLAAAFGENAGRPGIVHRLDKETSGVLIVARTIATHEMLAAQFRDRTTRKRYLAIVQGVPRDGSGRIENRLGRDPRNRKRFTSVTSGGRAASTRYRVLRTYGAGKNAYSLLLLAPRTGRTHQLRVHMKLLGTPILGDTVYGRSDPGYPDARLMLHARSLRIRLPGEEQPRAFVSPLPPRFRGILRQLQSSSPSSGL
jgi:23S rRNA pseudouridine1911/1915/1917 synthase